MNYKFEETIKQAIIEVTKNTFDMFNKRQQIQSLDYFMGGSQRFGYNNDDSDIDFFINIKEEGYSESISDNLMKFLYNNGFNQVDNTNHGAYSFVDRLFIHYQFKIHILIIKNNFYFENLKQDHNRIEIFLNNNPVVREYIKALKETKISDMKGKNIYKSLLTLCSS
jgi:hypothetical protein